MFAKNIRSLDVVWEQVRLERVEQLAHFDALDSKAGIVLGFSAAIVALAPEGHLFLVRIGHLVAASAASAAVWTFWPRRILTTDLRALRDTYLPADPAFARLRLIDTYIEMAESRIFLLRRKAVRLRLSMSLLVVSALITAVGLGLH